MRTKEDQRAACRKYYSENKEKIYARKRKKYLEDKIANPGKKRAARELTPEQKESAKEYHRAYNKVWLEKSRFSLSLKRSARVANAKNHSACNASEEDISGVFSGFCHNEGCSARECSLSRRLHMDHDHKNGNFRGWLCGKCNASLGGVGDSFEKLDGLLEYLESAATNR